jgi:hypothetical protein
MQHVYPCESSASVQSSDATVAAMSESPEPDVSADPTPRPPRTSVWSRLNRTNRIAAVIVGGIVSVLAAILLFGAGWLVGAYGDGHEGHHDGEESSQYSDDDGDREQADQSDQSDQGGDRGDRGADERQDRGDGGGAQETPGS